MASILHSIVDKSIDQEHGEYGCTHVQRQNIIILHICY